jgi:hypothetical protein
MNEFIFYRRKLVDNKYKKIYKKGKSKKEYVKSKGKYVLLTVYKKNLKKKNKKKGANINENLNNFKLQLGKYLKGGADSIANSDIKFDSEGKYIQSPECKMIFDNPEQYGITKAELNDTSTDAVKIMASRFVSNPLTSGGGKKKKKKTGGSYISEYLTKVI